MPKPQPHEPLRFIAIEGPIRVGKTTLADLLAGPPSCHTHSRR